MDPCAFVEKKGARGYLVVAVRRAAEVVGVGFYND